MCKSLRQLSNIAPHLLDDYLADGWFRMQQSIFTTRYLQHDGQFYETIWLRHRLADFAFPEWFLKMQHKGKFRVEITTGLSTPAHELLYQQYRETKPLDWSDSLESILYGDRSNNLFNTHIMNVYDGEKLVAAGFFDIGTASAAGICNFYDPSYKKFSLGKFLYYSEVLYCIENGLTYFYPGYITPGLSMFDYKVHMHFDSLEAYDPITRSWEKDLPTDPDNTAVDKMKHALCLLLPRLQNLGVDAQFVVNAGFAMNYTSKFDLPYVIYVCPLPDRNEQYAITYDPDTNEYYIFDTTESNCLDSLQVIGQETYCLKQMDLNTPLFILMSPGLAAETMADIVEFWGES